MYCVCMSYMRVTKSPCNVAMYINKLPAENHMSPIELHFKLKIQLKGLITIFNNFSIFLQDCRRLYIDEK